MKKYLFSFTCLILLLVLFGCSISDNKNPLNNGENENITEEETMKIKIMVNNYNLTATLENNESAKAFYQLVKDGLTLELKEYGGFEKVGSIGKTLPSNDKRINAQPGDLILYASNQLSFMYGTNSWSYTKLGRVDNIEQINLSVILGNKDVTITFSV